jgi:acetylglutamate kinase
MVTHRSDQSATVRALRNAAPYVRLFKGKVFVIKAGGAVFSDNLSTHSLIQQIAILHNLGIKVVLVHGGGPQLDQMQRSLGMEPRMVKGRRVTDAKTIDVTTMVLNGLLNTRILAICRDLGVEAIGISGVDAGLVRAARRPPVDVDGEMVDYGYVGDVVDIDASVIMRQLEAGLMPVVSPLSADDAGCVLNVNADTIAARIGAALGAEKLILCTGAPGILEDVNDPGSLVSYTDLEGLERLAAAGSFADGMLPKASAIAGAIRGGVRRVHVISYKVADSVLAEVFTNEGTGTLIVEDIGALTPAEQHPEGSAP